MKINFSQDPSSDLWYKLQELIESPVRGIGGSIYGPNDYAKAIRFLAEVVKSKPELKTSQDVADWLRQEAAIASQTKAQMVYEL